MKKSEFLAELNNKLQGLPKDDLESRLAFYSEMIDDRMEEGKSEEEAVADIGSVDDVVKQVAADTPLFALVKEKAKPKRSLRAWEIVLIVLGFPLWFPLVLTAFILCMVAYILIWVMVIVTYAIELSMMAGSVAGIALFVFYLVNGQFSLYSLGFAIMAAGAAVLLFLACIGVTKATIKLSQAIFTGIKTAFMRKGNK